MITEAFLDHYAAQSNEAAAIILGIAVSREDPELAAEILSAIDKTFKDSTHKRVFNLSVELVTSTIRAASEDFAK